MTEYNESEQIVDPQQEALEREAQEVLRRTIRTEIRRVQTGAADKDIADDIAREEEQAREEKRRNRPRWMVWTLGAITGDILLAEQVKRVYVFLTMLGVIFFASIATMFASLQQDLRYNRLEKEVERLKERAIRTAERRYEESSHTAILRKLKDRGIDIEDPKTQPTILK